MISFGNGLRLKLIEQVWDNLALGLGLGLGLGLELGLGWGGC